MTPLTEPAARRAGPEVMAWLDGVEQPPTNMVLTLIRQPRLLKYWLRFGGELMTGSLPAALRKLVILRVAATRRCTYEWAHHVDEARRLGWTTEQLEALGRPVATGPWDRRAAIVLRAVDTILEYDRLDERDVDAVTDELSAAGAVELILLVGHYQLAATLASSLGVEPEASVAATDVPW